MENIVIRPNHLLQYTAAGLVLLNILWAFLRKPFRFFLSANFFALYLVVLFSLTILPIPLSVFQPTPPETIFPPIRINLHPFNVGRAGTLSPQITRADYLNVLAFIPFGFLLPFTTKKGKLPILFYALLTTLAIETIQLLISSRVPTYSRAFDTTDLITNVLGAWLGYLIARLLIYLFKKSEAQP